MEIVKHGFAAATGSERHVLLRGATGTVFDIWKVRWVFAGISVLSDNELITTALSTRVRDQVEDGIAIGFDEMIASPGLFAASSLMADLVTEGGAAFIATDDIDYPKAFTVPFLASVINPALATAMNVGLEVYFERRKASKLEIASWVVEAGRQGT